MYEIINKVEKELGIRILRLNKCNNGVSNLVYRISTSKKEYILKKYMYDYNFELYDKIYKCYEEKNINCIKPIKEFCYNNYKYSIFPYIKDDDRYEIDINFLIKISSIINLRKRTKEVDKKYSLINKIQKYRKYLKDYVKLIENTNYKEVLIEDIKEVLNIYDELKDKSIFNSDYLYLNHGDLQPSNILRNQNDYYIIDFDEVCYANELYDFSVIYIKCFNRELKKNEFVEKFLKENLRYTKNELIDSINYYLCKILLEKFYLHIKKKINLFSEEQKKDSYQKYLDMIRAKK